jgi:hypothetical protein
MERVPLNNRGTSVSIYIVGGGGHQPMSFGGKHIKRGRGKEENVKE